MVYTLLWVFNQTELYLDKLQGRIMVSIFLLLPVAVVLVCFPYDQTRIAAYILTGGFAMVLLLYDYFHSANDRQKTIFYHSMIVESLFLAFGLLLFFCGAPETCCKKNRCIALYFNSYIILLICLLSFLYEI